MHLQISTEEPLRILTGPSLNIILKMSRIQTKIIQPTEYHENQKNSQRKRQSTSINPEMIQRLELLEKDVKATVIPRFQHVRVSTLETNGKILCKQTEAIFKSQREILEQENITEIKNSLEEFTRRMEMIEERVSELKDRSIENILNTKRKKDF